MARYACLVSSVSGRSKKAKNALGRGSASSRHIMKLEQSRFSLDIYDFISERPFFDVKQFERNFFFEFHATSHQPAKNSKAESDHQAGANVIKLFYCRNLTIFVKN
jgi:hypothetical protein